jgi:predicted alpha/beta-hydrolase family hydrolase
MSEEKVNIAVDEKVEVSGVLTKPDIETDEKGMGIILAHGAGNDMDNPLLVFLARGFAGAGFFSLRFNFPYKEKGKRAPDSQKVLVKTWLGAHKFLTGASRYSPEKIVAAGKSMGGRVASQMVSEGVMPVGGLIFYGYPLHAPGKKGKLRDAHLYQIRKPMLFFAGSRDALCDLNILRKVLRRLEVAWALETVEGGDHSFRLPKSSKKSDQEVYALILEKSIDWLETTV